MYVAEVPNRNSPPAILLRERFRENGKVRNRTIANLSHWPPARIAALRSVLKGESPAASPAGSCGITRSRPHGHCAAVLAAIDNLKFDDEQRGAPRTSPADPARRSAQALATARTRRTEDNQPVLSFQDWRKDLGTIARNRIQPRLAALPSFGIITRPAASPQRALALLGVKLQSVNPASTQAQCRRASLHRRGELQAQALCGSWLFPCSLSAPPLTNCQTHMMVMRQRR